MVDSERGSSGQRGKVDKRHFGAITVLGGVFAGIGCKSILEVVA